MANALSRPDTLKEGSTVHASYTFLGAQVLERTVACKQTKARAQPRSTSLESISAVELSLLHLQINWQVISDLALSDRIDLGRAFSPSEAPTVCPLSA